MARFDVDGSATTYHPSAALPENPPSTDLHSGGATEGAYWYYHLEFGENGQALAAAFEEWMAFHDGALHTIVLPPPNVTLGGDVTYSNVFIRVVKHPGYKSVNVGPFTVKVGPIEFTS